MRAAWMLAMASAAAAAPVDVAAWTPWAPRSEIAPRTFIDAVRGRVSPGALAISGASNAAAYGGWERTVAGVEPGQWYRLVAWYRAEGVAQESRQVVARLDWGAEKDKRAGFPDYAWSASVEGAWKRVTLDAPAPDKAVNVKLQLALVNAPQGTVWWDDVSFEKIAAPPPRPVSVAAVNFRPSNSKTAAENVGKFAALVESEVAGKTDVILLPEGITIVGTGRTFPEVAESIPGPTTDRLGELARSKQAWLVAGLYERDGPAIYNTAVFIDRLGRVVGKYRKVYLPREELEGGLTAGEEYPVFDTDFGRVGMMICWDLQYTDPARAMALQGAEMILMPIWGGNEILGKARAIENHLYLVSSGYDYPAQIVDPLGEVLAQASGRTLVARATVDLNRRYVEPWLGVMRGRFMKETRRP